MICPYCKKEAKWIQNKAIYGRNYGKSYMCYYCKVCDAYVGCHNNTREPLGTMANKELRDLRKQAHSIIDPLWKSGQMRRNEVYNMLKKKFGKVIHIGESDVELCNLIIKELV
ncbi:hypothetical protein LCGC14_2784650 [marine sediment metagenome]|uniref:Uncharacterized protein n=1 Tax=marine sediment metagenome TaxID=412755 RepID=A0A0F8ZED7_9ZZZZ